MTKRHPHAHPTALALFASFDDTQKRQQKGQQRLTTNRDVSDDGEVRVDDDLGRNSLSIGPSIASSCSSWASVGSMWGSINCESSHGDFAASSFGDFRKTKNWVCDLEDRGEHTNENVRTIPSSSLSPAAISDSDDAGSSSQGGITAITSSNTLMKHPPPMKRDKKKSALVTKLTQTLGWRSRYSQSDFYPITMMTVASRLANNCGGSKDGRELKGKNYFGFENDKKEGGGGDKDNKSMVTFYVKQVQRGEIDDTYGTGATVWPASVILLRYLEQLSAPDDIETDGTNHGPTMFLQNKTVVDLGAGTGILSIGSALLGASSVICTDGREEVVNLARENIWCASRDFWVGNTTPKDEDGRNNIDTKSRGNQDDVEKEEEQKIAQSRNATEVANHVDDGLSNEQDSKSWPFFINGCEVHVRKYMWGDGTMGKDIDEWKRRQLTPQQSERQRKNAVASVDSKEDVDKDNNDDNTKEKEEGEKQNFFYDVILVSDCVLPKLYPIEPLVDAINELSGPHTTAYVSYEHRYYPRLNPKNEFCRLANEKGLDVHVVPVEELDPIYSVDDVEIWKVTRRRREDGV